MESVDAAILASQRAARGEEGILRIGILGSASFARIPSAILAFRKKFPKVEIVLTEMRTSEQIQSLIACRLDVGIVRSESSKNSTIEVRTLMREPFVVALPRQHRLAQQPVVSIKDLRSELFVLYPEDSGPGLHEQVVAICDQAGFKPRVAQHASNISTITSFVAAGLGISIVPESVSQLKWTGVVYKPLQGNNIQAVLGLAFRGKSVTPLERSFIKSISAACRE